MDRGVERCGCDEGGLVCVEVLELTVEVRFPWEMVEGFNVVQGDVAGCDDVRYLREALPSG